MTIRSNGRRKPGEPKRGTSKKAQLLAALGMSVALPLLLALFNVANWGVSTVRADPAGIKYTGIASCSQCHGDDYDKNNPADKKSKEVEIWKNLDPHSKTYEQLTNEKGTAIAAKMKIADAKTDKYCISCHALSGLSTSGRVVRVNLDPKLIHTDHQMSEGTTCANCHGPSGNDKTKGWLVPHKAKDWTQKQRVALGSVKLFDDLGLYDTKDMKLRANLCYSCHMITDPDLIAAAHPHRPFESNVLYARYKKTSHFAGDKDEFAESKLWAVGQAISLREAADDMAETILKKKGDAAVQAAYEHLLAHSLIFRQIVPGAAKKIDDSIAAIAANRAQGEKMADPLKAIAQTADQEVDKLNSAKMDRAMAEGFLKAVASESAQAAQAGLPGASQYLFALVSLWGNLKDPKVESDEKFAKIKSLSKVLKPADNQSANYSADMRAKYAAEAGAVGALFPGGQAMPLPAAAFVVPEIKNGPAVAQVKPPDPPVKVEPAKVDPPKVEPAKVEPVKVPEVAPVQSPPLEPRKVYEDYSARAPLGAGEYGSCVFCLECGMRWPLGRNYCGRCGQALPRWEEKK